MRHTTQKEAILEHLESGNAITPLDALNAYGCFRLAAVIHVLKGEGFNIITDMVTVNEATFASYRLATTAPIYKRPEPPKPKLMYKKPAPRPAPPLVSHETVEVTDVSASRFKTIFSQIDRLIEINKPDEVRIKNEHFKMIKKSLKAEGNLVYRGVLLLGV